MMNISCLHQRLRVLRQEGGAAVPAEPISPPGREHAAVNLYERLQRLNAPRGAGGRCSRNTTAALARDLNGQPIGDGLVRIETRLPFDTAHGSSRLGQGVQQALDFFAVAPSPIEEAVFLDAETTGLAGGTGTVAFLLGIGRFTQQGLQLVQLLLTAFAGEGELLRETSALLSHSNTLISYNGKRFDHPLLAARCRLHGTSDPLANHAHLDLLYPTRSAFSKRWLDCRLATAERHLLQLQRRDDLPGWAIPSAWFDWVRWGENGNLGAVVRHNHLDILTLVALLPELQQAFERPLACRACIQAGARHHLRRANERAAFEHLAAHRTHLTPPALLELARLARRWNELTLAVEIWDELARCGNPEATEQLAKYQEHKAGNLEAALELAQRLVHQRPNGEGHQRRVARLSARLANRNGRAQPTT